MSELWFRLRPWISDVGDAFDRRFAFGHSIFRHQRTASPRRHTRPTRPGRDDQNKLGKISTRKLAPVAVASGVPPAKMAARSKLPEATSLEPAIAVMRLPKFSAMS